MDDQRDGHDHIKGETSSDHHDDDDEDTNSSVNVFSKQKKDAPPVDGPNIFKKKSRERADNFGSRAGATDVFSQMTGIG